MCRWGRHGGRAAEDGAFRVWENARGEYDLVPGWFKFTAEFDRDAQPSEGLLGGLQTWSAPTLPPNPETYFVTPKSPLRFRQTL